MTVADQEQIRGRGAHRPGVLVVDREKTAIADLDLGSYREVAVTGLFSEELAELRPVPGAPMPPPVPAREIQPLAVTPLAVSGRTYVLAEPIALRIDGGRVLAWDREHSAHCRLPAEHLRSLELVRSPATAREVSALLGATPEEAVEILTELVRLGLVDEGGDVETPAGHVLDAAEPEGQVEVESTIEEPPPVDDADSPHPTTVAPTQLPAAATPRLTVRRIAGRLRRLALRALRRGRRVMGRVRARLLGPTGPARTVAVEPVAVEPAAGAEADSHPPDPDDTVVAFIDVQDAGTAEPVDIDLSTWSVVGAEDPTTGAPQRGPWVRDGRVPVVPLYHFAEIVSVDDDDDLIEPSLSIGMLFAHARHVDGGRLNQRYHLMKVQPDPEVVFREWAADPVPAIFAFSDYIWNCDRHLELARRIKELSPESLCIHGGPSSPKYEPDTIEFFERNTGVDVAARGEGEHTFVEILTVLDGELHPGAVDRLSGVDGITFRRRPSGELVRTPDRERPTDLDEFPSPYLTGEFDELRSRNWRSASIETNRGCPYGCTFCDWGSATLSRIRKFDLDRVKREIEWIAAHAPTGVLLVSDANFGIFARDVEIIEHLVELKRQHPHLSNVIFAGVAKNTTKHTGEIYRLTTAAGLTNLSSSLAIQTSDEQVLEIVNRKNIKLEKYEQLAQQFRDLSLPMMTDIIFGLPGSTVETFKNDLQHCFDREVTARVFPLTLLPNSPMNEPSYREQYKIRTDRNGVVVSTSTYSEQEFQRMRWLRLIYRAADHFGALRHLLRYLQWDHGIPALEVIDRLDTTVTDRGNRFPLLAFYCRLSDLYTMPPVAWEPFFDEVVEFLAEQFGVENSSALQAIIELQIALMPAKGRTFPEVVRLEHDVLAYRSDHRVFTDDVTDPRPLSSYGPLEFEVDDPGGVCNHRIRRNDFLVRRDMESGNLFWIGLDWELASPFARPLFSNSYLFPEMVS